MTLSTKQYHKSQIICCLWELAIHEDVEPVTSLKMSFIVYWVFENLEEESTVASEHLLFNWFGDVLQGKDIQSAICVLSHSTLMQLTIRNLFPHSIQQATRGWFTKRHLFSSSTWRWCNNTSLTVALKYKTQEEFSLCVVNAALELTLCRIFIVK